MGHDKAVLRVDGRTLVEHVVRLIRPWVDDVVLSARVGQAGLPDERVVFDRAPGRGPLPAAVDALETVAGDVVLILAVDTPRLVPALIPLLQSRLADALAQLSTAIARQPHVWRTQAAADAAFAPLKVIPAFLSLVR